MTEAFPPPNPAQVEANLRAILDSPSYRLAETDLEFLARPELRPVRIQQIIARFHGHDNVPTA